MTHPGSSNPDNPRGSSTLARQYGVIGVIFLVALFNYVDRSILSILQVPIKRDLGLSDTQMGALTGLSFALLYATLALPIARLADTGKRTRLLSVSLAVWSGMTALVSLATGFWSLVVLRMGVAVGEAGSGPTSHSLIGDIVPRERRATALAVMALAIPVGTMLGFLAGGWLQEAIGWRRAFLFIGLAGLLFAPAVLLLKEPSRGGGSPNAPLPDSLGWRQAASVLWRLKSFRFFLLAATCQAYVLYSFQNWAAPFYVRIHHWSIADVGASLAFLFGVGGGLGAFFGGYVVDRLTRKDAAWYGWVPAIASAAALPLLLVQFFVPDPRISIAVGLGSMLALNVFIAPTNAAAQASVASPMRAFTSAMILAVPTIFGMGLGPLVTGFLSDTITRMHPGDDGLRYAAVTPLLLLPVGAWLFYRAGRSIRAEIEQGGAH